MYIYTTTNNLNVIVIEIYHKLPITSLAIQTFRPSADFVLPQCKSLKSKPG